MRYILYTLSILVWGCIFFALLGAKHGTFYNTYYMSPTGSDSNAGTSGSPWLTPNHSGLNCGDTINAQAGAYPAEQIYTANTCSGHGVVDIHCIVTFSCTINVTTTGFVQGWYIQTSNWEVDGWLVTTSSTSSSCYLAFVNSGPAAGLHDIIFANDVANGCGGGGFGSIFADYIVEIGDIAYNAAQAGDNCYSGISDYRPIASDTAAGTHLYHAWNYSYGNINPSTGCDPAFSGVTTDGEGIIQDDFDNSQCGGGGGCPPAYLYQSVSENNILAFNGGRGFSAFDSVTPPYATIIEQYDTLVGNAYDTVLASNFGCADVDHEKTMNVSSLHDLVYTVAGNACATSGSAASSYTNAYPLPQSGSTNVINYSWLYSVLGNTYSNVNATGWTPGIHNITTNPGLASVTNPGAPSCGSSANTRACMATLIANLTASTSGASAYGIQTPSNTANVNALYPVYLCSAPGVYIPPNISTQGCGTPPPSSPGTKINPGIKLSTGVKVQ